MIWFILYYSDKVNTIAWMSIFFIWLNNNNKYKKNQSSTKQKLLCAKYGLRSESEASNQITN